MLSEPLRHACQDRRQRLCAALGGRHAVVFSGSPRGRNYAGNVYPFRASSHFLYLVGLPLEGALLHLSEEGPSLLVPDPDPADALWHGAQPSVDALSSALGLTVYPFSSRLEAVRAARPEALPPFDANERASLATLLGRVIDDRPGGALARALVALRLTHDAAACHELRRAADVSVRAHLAGLRATRSARHEQDVCAAMEHEIARAGFTTAYGSIVTVHGEVLHNHAHHHPLEPGDLLLADVGAETDTGYAADITRTWPVSGTFSATQRDVYQLVLAAQRAAIAMIAPGIRYREVHLAAAQVITQGLVDLGLLHGDPDALTEDGAHALFFPHGIGHLLGLDVHDMEDLGDLAGYAEGRSRSTQFGLSYLRLDRDLAPGMLVTIEPGFYQVPELLADPAAVGLPGKALNRTTLQAFADVRVIRIEDDVLVTDRGHEVLTASLPKDVEAIEAVLSER